MTTIKRIIVLNIAHMPEENMKNIWHEIGGYVLSRDSLKVNNFATAYNWVSKKHNEEPKGQKIKKK